MVQLFADIDVLAAPVTAVTAFPAEEHWPRDINGVGQPDYLQWMRTCWRVSLTGFTAMSVPCGFTPDGLPVGLQLVGRYHAEALLFALGRVLEQEQPWADRWPEI
jgi:amidase